MNNHEYVDLGLPSGTLWATCNVGADKPEEFGDYFAWGEILPKKEYTWKNYKWSKGSEKTQTKYCTTKDYGTVDDLTMLEPADDAATANWGSDWRIPTSAEFNELKDNCNMQVTKTPGSKVEGLLFTSKFNGRTVFMPFSGIQPEKESKIGYMLAYWTAQLTIVDDEDVYDPKVRSDLAHGFFYDGDLMVANCVRCFGLNIRAVMTKKGHEPVKVSGKEWDNALYRFRRDIRTEYKEKIATQEEEITAALEEVKKLSPELYQRITDAQDKIKEMEWKAVSDEDISNFTKTYPNLRIDSTENEILSAIYEGIRKREGEADGPNKIYVDENRLYQDPFDSALILSIGRYAEVKTADGVEGRIEYVKYKVKANGMSFHTEGYEKTVTDLEADVNDFLKWLEFTHLTEKFSTGKFLPPKGEYVPDLPF